MANRMLSYWYRLHTKMTAPEQSLEPAVAALGLPYRAQHLFIGMHHVADFAILPLKLIIEADGDSHDRPRQKEKDLVHAQALFKLGWVVYRVTNARALRDPAGCVRDAVAAIPSLRESPQDFQAELDQLRRDYPALLAAPAKPAKSRKAPPRAKVPRKSVSRSSPRGIRAPS